MHVMCVSVYGYSMRTRPYVYSMCMCMHVYVYVHVWVCACTCMGMGCTHICHFPSKPFTRTHTHILYIHVRTANRTWCVPYFHPPFWGEGGGGGGENILCITCSYSPSLYTLRTPTRVCVDLTFLCLSSLRVMT